MCFFRLIRFLVAEGFRAFADAIYGPEIVSPERVLQARAQWGDLIDPPLPCGQCNFEDDECACLLKRFDQSDIKGMSIDKLFRDIAELEHEQE